MQEKIDYRKTLEEGGVFPNFTIYGQTAEWEYRPLINGEPEYEITVGRFDLEAAPKRSRINLCGKSMSLIAAHLGISRNQFVIKMQPNEYGPMFLISDLNSHNGTRINGEFVEPNTAMYLINDDIITIGIPGKNQTSFVVRIENNNLFFDSVISESGINLYSVVEA